MSSSRLAFIGAGNLASAIVRGLLERKVYAPADIACLSKGGESARRLAAATGIAARADLTELLANADTVIVAFKPQSLADADSRLAELTRGKLVISVLAGKKLSTLARTFPHVRNLVRTMPNTPAAIGAGFTPFCSKTALVPEDREKVGRLLEALGQCLEIGEEYFDALTAVGGSGPAFLFEFVAGMRDAGIAAGLPAEVSYRAALQTVLGASRLLASGDATPEALRDKVTSPNGTTFAGLQVLGQRGLRDLLRDTVRAAAQRAGELSKD